MKALSRPYTTPQLHAFRPSFLNPRCIFSPSAHRYLLPRKALSDDGCSWDPDAMLNIVKQQMQEEADDKESLQADLGAARGVVKAT